MSNGASGFRGYVYQANYAACRILCSVAVKRLTDDDLTSSIQEFTIEGRCDSEGEVWDVILKKEDGSIELLECKDAEITKEDRRIFYSRIRRELSSADDKSKVYVAWVTDPDRQSGNMLNSLRGIAELAQEGASANRAACPERVISPETGFQEALHYLCSEGEDETPPVSLPDALLVLGSLTVDERRHEDISANVAWLSTELFESGTGQAIKNQITGELVNEVAEKGQARYTLDQFLDRLETQQLVLACHDVYSDILRWYSAAGPGPGNKPMTIRWERLCPVTETQWPLEERLSGLDGDGLYVLSGAPGIGKTVTTIQAFEAEREKRDPRRVFWIEASAVSEDKVKALPGLCLMLSGVAPVWLAIDGLDEIEQSDVDVWKESVAFLGRIPKLTLIVSARAEVLAARAQLSRLTDSLELLELGKLSETQVSNAFRDAGLRAPQNPELIEVLCNPFLLSLYARIVSQEDDYPLEETGRVMAFSVIRQFWHRAVVQESLGYRAPQGSATSAQTKLEAIRYVVAQTLAGEDIFKKDSIGPQVDSGIDALISEAVFLPQGTHAVIWRHDWLKEYALIDRLIASIGDRGPSQLSSAVCAVRSITAGRVAARGAVKWVLLDPEWGPLESFLCSLYGTDSGLAREGLSVIMTEPQHVLRLADLDYELLIEAIEFAIQHGATQWADQIADLPEERFVEKSDQRLNEVVARYETSEFLNE